MAESYIPYSQAVELNNEFYNLQATFGRDIAIYQTATQTVISTNPDNNILFQNAPFNSTTETVIRSGVFLACILYGQKQPLTPFNTVQRDNASDQNMIRLEEGQVRVRLDATGAAFIAGADRVIFDDTIFDVETTKRPHGLLLQPTFYDFYLTKVQ
jgi:hypothetical protein